MADMAPLKVWQLQGTHVFVHAWISGYLLSPKVMCTYTVQAKSYLNTMSSVVQLLAFLNQNWNCNFMPKRTAKPKPWFFGMGSTVLHSISCYMVFTLYSTYIMWCPWVDSNGDQRVLPLEATVQHHSYSHLSRHVHLPPLSTVHLPLVCSIIHELCICLYANPVTSVCNNDVYVYNMAYKTQYAIVAFVI